MATAIARYLLDEASSGTAPLTCGDDTGNNNTLTVNYDTSNANWTSIAAGNGLEFVGPVTSTSARAQLDDILNNGTIATMNGATTAYFLLDIELDTDAAAGVQSRVFLVGDSTAAGELGVMYGNGLFTVQFNTVGKDFPSLIGSGRTIVYGQIDTTAAAEADRVRVWYNGVEQTLSGGGFMAANRAMSIASATQQLNIGNWGAASRNTDGKIYYLEFGTGNLTTQEIADSYSSLSTNNDVDWQAPSRSITNIDGDNDVQAGQTNITVTTVGMDSAPTVKTATLGGESLTVVSAGETSWVVSVPTHIDLEWGATHELALTDDTGTVTLAGVTLSAPAEWETVAFTTAPNPATTESFYEYAQTDTGLGGAGYTMLAGDILAWETQTGLTIDGQTIPQVDPPATVSGSYKIFKDATKTWTSVSAFTITDKGFLGVPTITNITSPVVSASSFTIDGLSFGVTQRNIELSQNNVLLSPTSWSDTQITANSVDIESSSLSYGNHTFSLDLPASTTTLLPNSNLSNALSGYYPAGDAPVPQAYQVTADNLVTTNTKPVVRGTCTEDGSTLSITVNGRTLDPDVIGGVWRASVSPFSVSRFTYVPYDREPVNQYAAIQGLYNHPDGTIISLYSISAGHVVSNSAFDVYVERSLDKGATWDTATVAPKSGTAYPRGNATYGVSSTGRLFYMSTTRDFEGTPDTIHNVWYTYSDDKGYTWSPLTDIKSSLFNSGMFVAWQSIVETPIGLVAMFYGAYGDNGTFKYSLSTDDGLTWGSLQTICTGYTDWAEPTATYLGDNKIVLMARAGGSLDANTYLAIKGTVTGGTIVWDTPLTPHNAALGATAGSPVSFVQVGSDVIACYSKRAATSPKTYTNRVTASDFWTDPYVIFTQTTYRSEVQEKTAIVGQSNWGYGQLCECRDAGSDSLGEDYTALVAWWEEGPTNTKLEIKMQTVSSVGGAQADVGPLTTGVYQVVANGTAADLSTDTSHACVEVE